MMSALSKMCVAEKEQYCENVYEKYIYETSEFLESCDEIAKILRTYIPSGCYTNFRDMLFHFRCLVNTSGFLRSFCIVPINGDVSMIHGLISVIH